MYKLDTGLIYMGRENCRFVFTGVHICTHTNSRARLAQLISSSPSISPSLPHSSIKNAPTCPSSAPPHPYRCPVFIASSSQWE